MEAESLNILRFVFFCRGHGWWKGRKVKLRPGSELPLSDVMAECTWGQYCLFLLFLIVFKAGPNFQVPFNIFLLLRSKLKILNPIDCQYYHMEMYQILNCQIWCLLEWFLSSFAALQTASGGQHLHSQLLLSQQDVSAISKKIIPYNGGPLIPRTSIRCCL